MWRKPLELHYTGCGGWYVFSHIPVCNILIKFFTILDFFVN